MRAQALPHPPPCCCCVRASQAGAGDVSLRAFDRAVALDPTRAQTVYLRGLLRHGTGQPNHALRDLADAARLDPLHAPSRYMVGVCLQVART